MNSSRLALLTFRDVVVEPYTELLGTPHGQGVHRGGPRWPAWSSQTAARHCRQGVPVDDEPEGVEPTKVLAGPLAWGGAITTHFGHQVADFSSRLLPTLAERADMRVAFSMHQEHVRHFHSLNKTPTYFLQILDWFGITHDRVELITEPTLVERLAVAPQGEQQKGGVEPWYLDLLDAHTESRLGAIQKSGSLYVSRAGQRVRFAAESYLERALEKSGFGVLRPETIPLDEQLRAYAMADRVVFTAGSAVHGTHLMGRALGDVTILMRRSGAHIGRPRLEPRSRSLRYVDAAKGVVQEAGLLGNPDSDRGLSIVDPDRLLAALPIADAWDADEFDAAVEADVQEWLERQRRSARWAEPESGELMRERLREAGLGHLG
jgi:hypothetical protein